MKYATFRYDTVEVENGLYALWCHKYDICILFKAKFLKKEPRLVLWTSTAEITNSLNVIYTLKP